MERNYRGVQILTGVANLVTRKALGTPETRLRQLAREAWKCWNHAYVLGNTKVGAAAMSSDGRIFVGCNVEHRFRCHDVHAEVNAITSMVASGRTNMIAIAIVANRRDFTPCGSCMDWVFQFGGPSCLVACQARQGDEIRIFRAKDLMPYYPRQSPV